jgi:hypothetical protein
MKNIEKEIKRMEQGEAWEDTDQVVKLRVKKPLDKVIPVRLRADHWEQLRELAGDIGVGPTTLARMWIIERLHHGSTEQERADTTLKEAAARASRRDI